MATKCKRCRILISELEHATQELDLLDRAAQEVVGREGETETGELFRGWRTAFRSLAVRLRLETIGD